tara:strand:- start:1001 stop:1564 length:564 start_codon:yes stop_codon:yes gene_type:complete
MWKGKKYSGRPTMKNGLKFEATTNLSDVLNSHSLFSVKDDFIYFENKKVGQVISQNKLYKWLENNDVEWKKLTNKQMFPDEAVINFMNNTLYLIEKKYQETEGSVDEKLQTFHFKIWFYEKVTKDLNINIDFAYLLSDWFFEKKYTQGWREGTLKYQEILDYLDLNNINVFRKEIPLDYLFPELKLL